MRASGRAKAWDLLAAFPLVCWLLFVAFFSMREVILATDWASAPIERSLSLINGFFALTLVVLIICRPAPLARSPGWRSIAAGLIGGIVPTMMAFLPRGNASHSVLLASNFVILAGTLASVWIVLSLGRAFSLLPQARNLVTTGPYRFVRHPLYLAEFVALFGLAWQFAMPWSLLFWCAAAAAQVPRMHFEERILTETFPDYVPYAARTARLLPGVY